MLATASIATLVVTGNAGVTGSLAVTGALTVTGNTVLRGDLSVDGGVTVEGSGLVEGLWAVSGAITSTGSAAINGNLAVTGTLIVTGASTFVGAVTLPDSTVTIAKLANSYSGSDTGNFAMGRTVTTGLAASAWYLVTAYDTADPHTNFWTGIVQCEAAGGHSIPHSAVGFYNGITAGTSINTGALQFVISATITINWTATRIA
jgi:cytoskeletal protein CcmA (bactofilin family)